MNLRRGMRRLWVLGSAAWVSYWAWHFGTLCALHGNRIKCATGYSGSDPLTVIAVEADAPRMLVDIAIVTFGVPAIAALIGSAVGWVVKGFVGRQKSN